MDYDQLKLENQLCFPVYAASRLIIRQYQPYFEQLNITYPQYLVLMVLWEHKSLTVNEIAKKLILNTNTITPLLKRMEKLELLKRERSTEDERKVLIKLTEKGLNLREAAADIPYKLIKSLEKEKISKDHLIYLRDTLNQMISQFEE
jgi:DNA-binding MarR family transcriptional regulator